MAVAAAAALLGVVLSAGAVGAQVLPVCTDAPTAQGDWSASLPAAVEFGGDVALCEKACAKWLSGCSKTVKMATQCGKTAAKAAASIDKLVCKADPDPKGCTAALKAAEQTAAGRRAAEATAALEGCESQYEICLTPCDL